MASLLDSRWAATPDPTLERQLGHPEEDTKPKDGVFASRWADDAEDEPSEKTDQPEEKPVEGITASRWADTPEPEPEEQQQHEKAEKAEKPQDGVFASRWAETPVPDAEEQLKSPNTVEKPTDGVFASRWAPTPEPSKEQEVTEEGAKEAVPEAQEEDAPPAQDTSTSPNIQIDGKSNDEPADEAEGAPKDEALPVTEPGPVDAAIDAVEAEGPETTGPGETTQQPNAPAPTHLEPPRLRKRVSWRGKNIVISIPRIDFDAAGIPQPMSEAEVQQRLQQFQDAGYNVLGYDLTYEEASGDPAQVRAIFPDDNETRQLPSREECKVLLPDLEKWRAYTDWLTEQKLAALGVTLGIEEPSQPPVPAQDMSRQSSQQYPPLPFSPPLPTASAGSSSMGRPGLVRGHSHTMSVASPASPLNGPFGHMHRHSTFTGPIGLPQLQQPPQPQSPGIPGLQPFSTQQQLALSGLPRGGSPAQISALRQELGSMRGPGSPLNQQMLPQSPQDYSRGLMDDQRRRQHAYSQSMQQPMMPNQFLSQGSSMRPTPALPELPEDEDEEEEEIQEPEPPAYVPPHKRVQANTEIAVPTPRGHRHNISEGLERELLEAEQRQKAASRDWIEVTEEEEQPSLPPFSKPNGFQKQLPSQPVERDPLGSEHPVQETAHSRKKSASRFNVAAPAFTFNPGANFQPGVSFQPAPVFQQPGGFQPPQSTFTFGAPAAAAPAVNDQSAQTHRRHQSSGSFNANAPSFKPVTSEFSFSSSGPTFKANGASEEAQKKNIVDELPSIFGKIDIPDIVKPARRSKAIAIVRPDEAQNVSSGTDFEDDEGRVAQGDAKRKQARKIGDDGDQVPLFAEPSAAPALPVPPEKVLGSNADKATVAGAEHVAEDTQKGLEAIAEKPEEDVSPEPAKEDVPESTTSVDKPTEKQPHHGHKHSSSLSALARPFQPPGAPPVEDESKEKHHEHFNSISELEEGEIREDGSPSVSPIREQPTLQRDFAPASSRPAAPVEFSSQERIDKVENHEPSFDEIDAVMRQLNADESEKETIRDPSPTRLPSPGSHPMKGVTYLAEWSRSDAPSPSPDRKQLDLPERTDSVEQELNGWPQVRQLNRAEEAPTSDWSGMLSPPDEEKLQQRSNFFDSHIDSIIGRVVEQRLQPLEESLRHIQNNVSRGNRSTDLKLQRSSSNVESDADDEDEGSDEQKQRPISRGRDKRVDQIKAAVLEALREQSPVRSQTAIDVAELHSVLADMKVSFARAASASLELDDIRAVVEDSLNRQSQAVVPIEESKETHRRELSELEGRLNETLAGALEEANHRRAIEERETEARRQLRLAEEELNLLRDSSRDEESKIRAMEQERQDLIDRLDRSEDARRQAEDKLEDAEAEKDALQATLEEYRVSSNKWRQDIDDGKLAREELENTIASMERQNEDYQESSGGMKRRLEKLHSDMATAAGQLASEKAVWKSKEEDYRAKIEALESQQMVANRDRVQLEDELRVMRGTAIGAAESQHTIEHLRATNASLDEMVRKLQGDLTEQQVLAVRFERQFHDAQESGRAEVHRTRMSLETEVEAANNHVNLVRAELETELSRIRTELENTKMEADTARARHEHLLEEEETARREALRKVNHSNSIALDEARHKYESAIQELTTQQSRALSQAFEDKERTEGFLKEKLALSEAKLQHFQERVSHLEERLEVAKSAAQAAALSAKASKTFSPPASSAGLPSVGIPEKVSPQALRESILVLQEQLQERETRIERLEAQVQQEGVTKVKERDTEINWLRELLALRSDELTELVNTLSRPNFDRATVRDTAIRIRANLQMEQQEKERSSKTAGSLGGQALASLTSLTSSPRAAQLSSAFNKWRESMESSALKSQQLRAGAGARSYTPSKVNTKPNPPSRFPSGLMTPPASNLRSSPAPETTNTLPPPQLNSRPGSKGSAMEQADEAAKPRSRHASATEERPSTPLFREQSYDQDAEDHKVDMQTFEDDDLDDVADSEPPAFRSLEAELEDEGGMEE
ncbi:hypothetical protein PRZ48_001176 [Zasmidium cellare]|uniref:Myosin class II heavy chain n=1 Tax=Zasmidium cellare TaxID=395010 RepID=A0ABR0F279_ZASCE|nr:hypothetical protein PRZ48_001176 [Zasmidium cellare]